VAAYRTSESLHEIEGLIPRDIESEINHLALDTSNNDFHFILNTAPQKSPTRKPGQ